ncbi:hypothetical protein GCM10011533_05760 [Streptosporangium jomthongense]|uniref:DUF4136 domain-containing protein n=1 Tax=Marinobacter aromaticivorans TaxID=1494078 RepID=A0ABW2ISA8_9GAMM|nr:DUF4136 domain-containing protein [Marinobacter aromaticivorans]GGE56128.1 hypothetical protein GCM10011533_05760 [Streptosporangium jomthongense]
MARFLIVALVALAMAGCASNVVTDYNSAAVFDNYSSWAFAPVSDNSAFVSLDGNRVRNAIERELNGKAMSKVDAEKADLLVSWRIVEEDRLEQSGVGLGLGFGTGNFGWGLAAPPPVREVKEGKLVVELVDRSSEQVVWRAASRRYLNEDQSPEKRTKLVNEVVAEMFSKYPPGRD